MSFSKFYNILSICLAVILTDTKLIAATDSEKSNYEFDLNDNRLLSKQHQDALQWILENWEKPSLGVFSKVKKLDLEPNIKEISLMIDQTGDKWSGFWALSINCVIPTFNSDCSFYIEFHRDRIIQSHIYGTGFVVNSRPSKKALKFLAGQVIKNAKTAQFSPDETELLAGIWVLREMPDSDLFNKCFGFNYHWDKEDLNGGIYLKIASDLSCELHIPYTGTGVNPWRGVISGIEINVSGDQMRRFVTLTSDPLAIQNLEFDKANFITAGDTKNLEMWSGGKSFWFERKSKTPMFDTNVLDLSKGGFKLLANI